MHFNLRGALGIGIPVLLGSALAVGVAALPASATTWQDTALSAGRLTVSTFGGTGLGAANGTDCHQAVGERRNLVATWHATDRRVLVRDNDQLFG